MFALSSLDPKNMADLPNPDLVSEENLRQLADEVNKALLDEEGGKGYSSILPFIIKTDTKG